MRSLIGKNIKEIFMNEKNILFKTDKGDLFYKVTEECCSESYIHDFIGVKKILENGEVLEVKELDTIEYKNTRNFIDNDHVDVYGFSITTESEKFGEQTSVFSFRNESNGYYGGQIQKKNQITDKEKEKIKKLIKITDDFINI